MNAEFNKMRTDLANNFASAGAALLDYMTIDGTKTAALAAIPETDPQQYAIAGTLAGIAQMLPKAAPGVEAMVTGALMDESHPLVDLLKRAVGVLSIHDQPEAVAIGLEARELIADKFATGLAATTQASTARSDVDESRELWETALSHAAMYVEAHCVDGETHADAIMSLARPSFTARIPQASTAQAELVRIGKLIATQDNRYTDQPMFIVQQRRRLTGFDTDYCDQIIWLCSEDDYSEASAEEAAELEAEYQETGRSKSGWMRTGYTDQWEFVTACFTEQGCKDYLKRDGHNLKEPRIYADGSYRNEEFRTIRNWLMGLAATSSTDAQAAAEVRDTALDEAAKLCETEIVLTASVQKAAKALAQAIRALKSEVGNE